MWRLEKQISLTLSLPSSSSTAIAVNVLSDQFSHSVMSDYLWHHRLQHARSPCPSPTRSLLRLRSIESVMPPNHLILCRPLLLLPSIFPSIRVFSNESVLHIRWPEYWSFSFSISPSSECSLHSVKCCYWISPIHLLKAIK